jgi:tellurite resistance protein TerC
VIPGWLAIGASVVMVVVIGGDLALAVLRPRVPKAREAAVWIGFYVALALGFGALLYVVSGDDLAGQFTAGWLTEYSLSIDNLFVFVVIMGRFSVPKTQQQGVLLVGIIIALVLRGVFILLGVTLITHFSWVFYVFGAFLIYTAINQLVSNHKTAGSEDGRLVRFLRRHIPITPHYEGGHLTIRRDGHRMFTPILVVFLAIGTTDLLFALDSIPAVFGITQNAFLVFAANVFALMGLRQLYFLLGHLIDRLAYLTYGITLILLFIAVKLVFHALHDNSVFFINGGHPVEWAPEFGTITSLSVIVLALAVSVGASLVRLRIEAQRARRASADGA